MIVPVGLAEAANVPEAASVARVGFAATVGEARVEVPDAAVPDAVVSLGDSYSSGLGAGAYEDDCDRTPRAWNRIIFGSAVSDRTLLACSGARIPDVAAQVGQLAALPDASGSRLITVTVGGNDVGFATELVNCLASVLSCTRREPLLTARIAELHDPLVQLYRSIQQAAPGDEIIVGGYPMLVRDPGVRRECPALTSLLSVSEREMIRRLGVALNDAIEAAASEAGVGVATAELEEVFAGHEACANAPEDWLYGLKVSLPEATKNSAGDQTNGPTGQPLTPRFETKSGVAVSLVSDSFHPNATGQVGYAQAFEMAWFSGAAARTGAAR